MNKISIRLAIKEDSLDITVHDCPKKLFEKLNLNERESMNIKWKELKADGAEITFFLES